MLVPLRLASEQQRYSADGEQGSKTNAWSHCVDNFVPVLKRHGLLGRHQSFKRQLEELSWRRPLHRLFLGTSWERPLEDEEWRFRTHEEKRRHMVMGMVSQHAMEHRRSRGAPWGGQELDLFSRSPGEVPEHLLKEKTIAFDHDVGQAAAPSLPPETTSWHTDEHIMPDIDFTRSKTTIAVPSVAGGGYFWAREVRIVSLVELFVYSITHGYTFTAEEIHESWMKAPVIVSAWKRSSAKPQPNRRQAWQPAPPPD